MVLERNVLENELVLIKAGARVDFIPDVKQGSNILQLIIKNINFKDKIQLDGLKVFVDQEYYDINHCDLWAK